MAGKQYWARPGQALLAHLEGVAAGAEDLARDAGLSKDDFMAAVRLAGLLHDLGKFRQEFQDYLLAGTESSVENHHAVYGAAAACCEWEADAVAFAIAGHHAGLHDASKLSALIQGDTYRAVERYPDLLAHVPQAVKSVFSQPPDERDQHARRRYEVLTRFLFSLLVDADRLDSEKAVTGQPRRVPRFHADCLLDRLLAARNERAAAHDDSLLNRIRNSLFDGCMDKGRAMSPGFFALTVPTGGGKTLSSMAFALSHAKRHGFRRVFVVIPYLSIIEQNAAEYRSIFGAGQVLEHHSAVETARASGDQGATERKFATQAELAMENWDAPIVVTTSVEFIETLFAARASRARKLHNIAGSVVIFDEVQALPTHLLEPLLDVLRELNREYTVSFVFCSATQPAFRRSASLPSGFSGDELLEIAPDPLAMYKSLRRVNYTIASSAEPWDWPKLAERMVVGDIPSLAVLNLRRHAFDAWTALLACLRKKDCDAVTLAGVFHLSSAMCPAHRLDRLGLSKAPPPNNMKARLKAGKPCWVISTQLIEAGVDVDFPRVFRAMGPLDSIVQCAGRCNREGRLEDADGQPRRGEVVVFYPAEDGLPRGIYQQATAITPAYLDTEQLATDPAIFARYFDELHGLSPTDHQRRGESTIQADRAEYRFRTVAQKARVISEATIGVIVPYGRAQELVQRIRQQQRFDRNTLRSLQRYMVNVRDGPKSDYAKLQALCAVEPLLPERLEIPVLADGCYSMDVGVVVENRPTEDFIV